MTSATQSAEQRAMDIAGGIVGMYGSRVSQITGMIDMRKAIAAAIRAAEQDAANEMKERAAQKLERQAEMIQLQWASEYRGTGALSVRDSRTLDSVRELKDAATAIRALKTVTP